MILLEIQYHEFLMLHLLLQDVLRKKENRFMYQDDERSFLETEWNKEAFVLFDIKCSLSQSFSKNRNSSIVTLPS